MRIELQLIIYFIIGIILLYILFLRKKTIQSISVIMLYVGLGFLFFGGVKEHNLYEYIGIIIIFFSLIVAFIQYYISNNK